MSQAADRDISILIVGAGPTGLTAALELRRRGFFPRIVEQDAGPHEESRALAVNPRTLDILSPSGVSRKLVDRGFRATRLNFHSPTRLLFSLDLARMPHQRRYMLVLPQADTERTLMEALGGNAVQWGTRLASLDTIDGRARAVLETAGGSETVTPDILIGADGAHSTARHGLGIGFSGSAYEHEWGLADVEIDGSVADGELHIFDLSPVLFGLIPVRAGLFRAVCDHPDVLDRFPPQIRVERVVWQSKFRISHRIADTFQRGNVFLVGDAAHIHSPLGGRGMNLGVEDAAWLAWLIESGTTGRYTNARRPVADGVLKTVDRATRMASSDAAIARLVRRRLLPPLVRLPAVQRRVLRMVGGLNSPPPPWLDAKPPEA